MKGAIPRKTVYRLSLYYRVLQRLRSNGIDTVSSEALAKASGVKSTQLRKDLAYFGHFGTRGLGYGVEVLAKKLGEVLGTACLQPVILVGVGQLGSALLGYGGFARQGFEVVAAFDAEPLRPRLRDHAVKIYPMEEMRDFIGEKMIKIAILTLPGQVAQEVANDLVASGIQALLNFAPAVLQVPENVVVNNVDLAAELENLSYFIN
ncbi:MAG: redox-sensing transcriptional repressor Rex [Verrucomicrobiota bacterium]